jgi:hypothetical protein
LNQTITIWTKNITTAPANIAIAVTVSGVNLLPPCQRYIPTTMVTIAVTILRLPLGHRWAPAREREPITLPFASIISQEETEIIRHL